MLTYLERRRLTRWLTVELPWIGLVILLGMAGERWGWRPVMVVTLTGCLLMAVYRLVRLVRP
jgi:hypothetical protein